MGNRKETIQIQSNKYTNEILNRLIGIFGNTKASVANYIIMSWIQEHKKELERFDDKESSLTHEG